jgi:hypothetical protein
VSATDQGAHLGDDTLLISHSTPPTPHANTNCRRLFHPCWVLTWGSEPRVPGCEWRPRMASETAAAEQEAKAAGRGMWGPPCFGQTTSVPEWFVEVARGLSRHRRCDQRLNAQSGPPMSMARTETQELESRLNWFAILFTQISGVSLSCNRSHLREYETSIIVRTRRIEGEQGPCRCPRRSAALSTSPRRRWRRPQPSMGSTWRPAAEYKHATRGSAIQFNGHVGLD